jgi:hypothetical protein
MSLSFSPKIGFEQTGQNPDVQDFEKSDPNSEQKSPPGSTTPVLRKRLQKKALPKEPVLPRPFVQQDLEFIYLKK